MSCNAHISLKVNASIDILTNMQRSKDLYLATERLCSPTHLSFLIQLFLCAKWPPTKRAAHNSSHEAVAANRQHSHMNSLDAFRKGEAATNMDIYSKYKLYSVTMFF